MGFKAGTSSSILGDSRLPDNITSALQPCQALTLVVFNVVLMKEKSKEIRTAPRKSSLKPASM